MTDEPEIPADPIAPPIPNYATTSKVVKFNDEEETWVEVRYGTNPADQALPAHVLEVRKTDMADSFDLIEIAGAQVDNDIWLSLAMIAMSVRKIDNVPQLSGNVTKAGLRKTLRSIGPLGVRAVRRALGELDSSVAETPQKAAVGN